MKMELLITNVTANGSPTRAESEVCWIIFDVFWSIQIACVVGEPRYDLETPSWALNLIQPIGPWKKTKKITRIIMV